MLGDESGYEVGEVQQVKLAAVEAEWETQVPPASFTLFGIPNEETQRTDYALKIPAVLGLIATRSVSEEVKGLQQIKEENLERIIRGQEAYDLMQRIRDVRRRKAEAYRKKKDAEEAAKKVVVVDSVNAEKRRLLQKLLARQTAAGKAEAAAQTQQQIDSLA